MMSKCAGCGVKLDSDFSIRVVEMLGKNGVSLTKFHSWVCLVKYLIDKGMVIAEVKPCA